MVRPMGYYDSYLEHHGILGMKWGIRRFEKAGGGLTEAGKKRYSTDENGNYKKIGKTSSNTDSVDTGKKKGLSDEQKAKLKKAAIIAGAATATTLAAYGGYKLYKINKEKKAPIRFNLSDEPVNVDKELSIAKSLLDNKKVSETSKNSIRDAIDMVNKNGLNVGRDRASDAAYRDATQLLRAENDYANQFLRAKGLTRTINKKPLSESKQLKQEYKDFVKNNTESVIKDTSERFKALKEDLKKETNPYRIPSSKQISDSNERLQNVLNQMTQMATSNTSKISSVSKQQSDYTQALLKKHSKTLSNYSMSDLSKMDLW